MKISYVSKDHVFNALLALNIIALIVVYAWHNDLTTFEWFLRSVLAIHLVVRWPHIFYHRNGWKP